MNNCSIQLLFVLLRSAICGNQLEKKDLLLLSDECEMQKIIALSKQHDIAHLVAEALNKNGLLSEEHKETGNEIIKAIYRYTRLNHEYVELCNALEAAQIQFIPLKGSVLRQWYPEPWMRTSCDIDILVHESEVEMAAQHLIDKCGYTYGDKGAKDISMFTVMGNHIELHYGLVRYGLNEAAYDVLNTVWSKSIVRNGYKYWFEMSDEMFYFYHIAHMAKHFVLGGCGIRPFIDLWILDNIVEADYSKRNILLRQGDLFKFAEEARKLSRVWLENAEHDDVSRQMEKYILRGGVYGTTENRVTIQQQKQGGRLRYIISRMFLPYDVIKFHYPILQKHRWLTPVMEIRRWFKLAFCGYAKRSVRELKQNSKISISEAENIRSFLKNIGL